ncbi:MAG: TonB-dependent receptor [Acidobacteriota bacterium]
MIGLGALVATAAVVWGGTVAGPRAGRSLASLLDELRQEGLQIVYSTALVRPEMTVLTEPEATEPRRLLDEILRPHGLAVFEASGGQLVVVAAPRTSAPPTGSIRGMIEAPIDGPLLTTVSIRVEGTPLQATVSEEGRFELGGVPSGEQALAIDSPFFEPRRVERLTVRAGEATTVTVRLEPAALFLSEIVVTPSHLRIQREQPEVRMFLSREEVDRTPHAGDDLLRALRRLPGATGGDFSSKLSIRGGEDGEVLLLVDGLELYEPFHLKDFQSMFSTVDSEAVGGVDFLTGGYPVEYGDRMSGVIDVSVDTPPGETTTAVSVSTIQARAFSQGSFNGDRSQWLVSARAWYPSALLDLTGATKEKLTTDYQDVLAKVQHRLGARSLLAVDLLWANDDLRFFAADEEETEEVEARYRSHHLWANLRTDWSASLFSETVLAGGRIERERTGGVDDVVEGTLAVEDRRTLEFLTLRQDWRYQAGDRHLLKWGIDLRTQEANYHYARRTVEFGDDEAAVTTVGVDLEPEGESFGLYAADRFRPLDSLVVELGLRWDRQTWVGDHQLSPRVNALFALSPHTTLRAAWGRFWQSQRLNELQVEDGVTTFFPAQLAEHIVVSVEHRPRPGLVLRLEAYDKRLDRLRPRWENLFNPFELFPEARSDRVLVAPDSGRARGVELTVRGTGRGRLAWWGSYAFSSAEDMVGGDAEPRNWDQRHAASLGVDLRLPRGWGLNAAATYHTGWPTTDVSGTVVGEGEGEPEVELVPGPRNHARYADYLRLDLRAEKSFTTKGGELTVIVEVLNLTDRANVCCVEDFATEVGEDGIVTVTPEYGLWAPIVPSLGVRWRF